MKTTTIREAELSFCFPHEASHGDMKALLGALSDALGGTRLRIAGRKPVTDHYLDPHTRIRDNNGRLTIDEKSGDKAGIRDEKSSPITAEARQILTKQARLTVSKERFTITAGQAKGSPLAHIGPLDITVDSVHIPMRVTIADIECREEDFKFLSEEFEPLRSLKRNTKPAWHYFTRKIGFCGAPSSGKSAMTRKLVNALSIDHDAAAEQITEYARTHIARYGKTPKWHSQTSIMAGQRKLEEDARDATVLVTDSPIFLGYIYMLHYLNEALSGEVIHTLSQAYADALSNAAEYTDLFLLSPREAKEDGKRITEPSEITRIHAAIQKFLQVHNIPHSQYDREADIADLIDHVFAINRLPQDTDGYGKK
jgi:nicotinamide riboside kinase